MPNETDRPQTFEEWYASRPELITNIRTAAEMGWHARDAGFAQVEKERDQARQELDAHKQALAIFKRRRELDEQ